jgi:cell division septation protein DedD
VSGARVRPGVRPRAFRVAWPGLRSWGSVVALFLSLCLSVAAPLAAQAASTPALDSAVARARRLVNEGAGAVGRSVVDSVLARVTPGSPDEATILFWRATLAESWEAAQQDYLRLMLEFDGSALAGEAMLRLAQGELARGDRAAAEQYLERLARETPEAPARAEAALWHGRLLLERGEAVTACPILRDGRARLGRAAREPRAPREATDLLTRYEVLLISCANLEATPEDTTSAAPAPVIEPRPASAPVPAAPVPTTPGASAPAAEWTVQLGAYATRNQATAVVRRLGPNIAAVRIDEVPGGSYPFKVRFGRFTSRAEAETAASAHTRRTGASTFVTEAPPR